MAGALVITNNGGGSAEIFNNILPSFITPIQLERQIVEYLANDLVRQQKVSLLKNLVSMNHTYNVRAKNLRTILKKYIENVKRFSIKIGVPNDDEKDLWGDWHFAVALRDALIRRGHAARIDILPDWYKSICSTDDIVIVLRGLSRYRPNYSQVNLLWLISHPKQVDLSEFSEYDHSFVASTHYCETLNREGVICTPLLQCTEPKQFYRDIDLSIDVPDVIFVGNSRKKIRKIVSDAITAGVEFGIFGSGWEGLVPDKYIKGNYIPNRLLRKYYSRAKIVLNDHWSDMAENGFVSNRIYDASICGSLIISDNVIGSDMKFAENVIAYNTTIELKELVDKIQDETPYSANHNLMSFIEANHSFDARVSTILDRINRLNEVACEYNES
jgi:hypothetical protein